MRPTYLTINTSLVRENLRKIKDSLPEWSTSTAVIKANGYGHGSVMMGRIAVEEGYESLAVAIPEESVPLRNAGIKTNQEVGDYIVDALFATITNANFDDQAILNKVAC